MIPYLYGTLEWQDSISYTLYTILKNHIFIAVKFLLDELQDECNILVMLKYLFTFTLGESNL